MEQDMTVCSELRIFYFLACKHFLHKEFKLPCHHSMTRPQVANRDGLQISWAGVNIFNKHFITVSKGWSSSVRLGEGLTSPLHRKQACYKMLLCLQEIFQNHQSNGKWTCYFELRKLRFITDMGQWKQKQKISRVR
jgi:hypothetical protein